MDKPVVRMIVGVVVFVALVGSGGTADATWFFSHGNASQIEYPANCTYKYFGWGLDLTQTSGLGNWIHMTVPTRGDLGARYFRLKFYRGSADAIVSKVHVYNGNVKVREFNTLTTVAGWNDRLFDMGSRILFPRGMGISIQIGAGVEAMSHRFVFASAGADFY